LEVAYFATHGTFRKVGIAVRHLRVSTKIQPLFQVCGLKEFTVHIPK